jgi:putative transcriptional regulator
MSKTTTTVRIRPDRTLERKTENGWERIDIRKARRNADPDEPAHDPDNLPFTEEERKRLRRISPARHVRLKLGLSQAAFAERYHIPIGTLRDWEQHRSEPDAPAKALLRLIAADPEWAATKLNRELEPTA